MADPTARGMGAWRAGAQGIALGIDRTPNLTSNSTFALASPDPMEPRFLYPKYGALPLSWIIRSMPTEMGAMALVDDIDSPKPSPGKRAIRIEGAWDSQLFQWIRAKPGSLYLATAQLRGLSSSGGDSSLVLTFLSGEGGNLDSKAQSLPKGNTPHWRIAALGNRAPEDTAWVGVGVACTRQVPRDWLEAESVELRTLDSAL